MIRNPQPLEIAELPPIRAATQFGSTLLLSLAAMGDQTSRIASYDPASQRRETLAVPQGVVTRFHEIGPAGARRLFAEITPTKANPPAAEPLASEMDLRQLVEVCSSAEAGPSWTCRPVDGQWLDIDSDSLSLMAIDAEHRLHRYSMADNTFIDAGLTGRETLPADIRAARGVEDELVALLEDQTLWCYSLRTLRWTHQEPDRKFAALVVAGNQLYAIDADSGNFLEYATEDDDRKWRPLAKPAGVFDDTVYLDGQHQKRNDQWQSVGAKSYSWRPSDPKARLATIAIDKGRFDFNRYRRLAVRGGTVWLQTLAERDGHPVCRELRTGAAELDEVAVGDERFAVRAGRSCRSLPATVGRGI